MIASRFQTDCWAPVPPHESVGKVYNIACGKNRSSLEICYLLALLVFFDRNPVFGAKRNGDLHNFLPSIFPVTQNFGYVPSIGLPKGLGSRRPVSSN